MFVDPFKGVDLATVDKATLSAVQTMREAAEDAETSLFNPAIDAATDDASGDALQAGKIKNKVLKLTGEVQALNIQVRLRLRFSLRTRRAQYRPGIRISQIAQTKAAGKDTASLESKVAAEQKKLTKNIQLDTAAKGQPSQGVTGGAASTGTNDAAASSGSDNAAASSGSNNTAAASGSNDTAASSGTKDTAASSGSADGSSFSFAVQE